MRASLSSIPTRDLSCLAQAYAPMAPKLLQSMARLITKVFHYRRVSLVIIRLTLNGPPKLTS